MSRHHRTLVRVFGTLPAILDVHRVILMAEAADPSHSFRTESLDLSPPDGCGGIVYRAERNRQAPVVMDLDFTGKPFSNHEHLLVEVLHDDEDREHHTVFSNGKCVYRCSRQEETGDIYELGEPGVRYVEGAHEGVKNAFLLALQYAGVMHRLTPL